MEIHLLLLLSARSKGIATIPAIVMPVLMSGLLDTEVIFMFLSAPHPSLKFKDWMDIQGATERPVETRTQALLLFSLPSPGGTTYVYFLRNFGLTFLDELTVSGFGSWGPCASYPLLQLLVRWLVVWWASHLRLLSVCPHVSFSLPDGTAQLQLKSKCSFCGCVQHTLVSSL